MRTRFLQRRASACATSATSLALLALVSCGGGTGGGGGPAPLYAIGGTVTGLSGVAVLQDNGGDDLAVSADGSFAFPTSLASGAPYTVTVKTQPVGPAQTCVVANGSGGVAGAPVNAVTVHCSTNLYSVTGVVTGLTGSSLRVEFIGSDSTGAVIIDQVVPVPPSTTQITFVPAAAPSGTTYRISVFTQPTGPDETCTVSPSSGTTGAADVTNIVVTCVPNAANPCIIGYNGNSSYTPVLRGNGATVVTHPGNVTADETWAGNGTVHLVPNAISIVAPATVTIQPCAIVKFAPGAGIDIRGDATGGGIAKLVAAGTNPPGDYSPVVFQNADNTLAPAWGRLRGLNKNSIIDLSETWISGGGSVGGSQLNAVISTTGSSRLPDPTLKVSDVWIDARAGAGIYFSDAAFAAGTAFLEIDNAADSIIAMPAMALGSIPLDVAAGNHKEVKVVENANVFDNLTIATIVPIHFKTDGVHVGGLAPTFVPNVTLTLQAGVTLKFEGLTGPPMVLFGDLGQATDKNAALVVQGTAGSPVIFTSGKAAPAPGDWAGLWLATSNGSHIDHAIIEYAGGDAAVGPASCGPFDPSIAQRARNTAALLVGDGTDLQYVPPPDLVTNTTFRNNTGNYAIDSVWEASAFGPTLNATNVFGAGPKFCTQGKNLHTGGCVVSGVDQSGCLVP